MCDGLGVCCDAVVLFGSEVDMLGVEASQDRLDFGERGVGCTVLDEDERLPPRINARTMQGVTGDDINIGR